MNAKRIQALIFFLAARCLLAPPAGAAPANPPAPGAVRPFDADWRFLKAEVPGAQEPAFNDSAWRRLNLTHDWSIDGPFAKTNSPGGAGAFLPAGIGWYRKHFSLPPGVQDRRVFVVFDGVMANSDVWINGFHLGHRPYGYVSFVYELTGHLNVPGDNVLAVRVDDSAQPASRWYAGAGIYRHVRLLITGPIHIEPWGVFISTPQVEPAQARIHARVTVTNESDAAREISLKITLFDPAGKVAGTAQSRPQMVSSRNSVRLNQDLIIKNPARWNLDTPALYRAQAEIEAGGQLLDSTTVPFGIREFHFDPATGFWLNGRNFKIKGVCLHGDGSAFGTAVPLGVWQRRLAALKKIGVNAIRTAHNPPAPEFLDLCDRMGFLVMDEFFDCWTVGKNPYDYHLYFNQWSKTDEGDSIRRDRNHPCIILYSVGNEIHDTPHAALAKGILRQLVAVAHQADPTRPVTQALFRPNVSGDYTNGLADLLDVVGTNYRDNELLAAQRAHPWWKIIGTEQSHDLQTWLRLRDHPSLSGQFLWTGVDYLGESRRWPVVAAGSGLLDRTGEIKPMGYQRQSWWSDKPMVFVARRVAPAARAATDPGFSPLDRRPALFADWSPTNDAPHEENVEVYSNCRQVELFLNGKFLGSQPLPADDSPRHWNVLFRPGTLRAVGKNHGRIVARWQVRTAGPPARILLQADHTRLPDDWDDVCYVRATVVDRHGVRVPSANQLIHFNLTGPGVIAAVDSADNSSHEPFQARSRRAFQGRCFAIIKATAARGKIKVTASSVGLKPASLKVRAAAPVEE